MSTQIAMPLVAALQVLVDLRRDDQVVLTTMSAAREWPKLASHPLDLHYIPSTMGGGPPLGLGIALAQPQREVLVLTGDGSLLMNLGSLVTIVASGAKNLTITVLDNGVYEVTGGQRTAGSVAGLDFAALAREAGFATVSEFSELAQWQSAAKAVLSAPGPRFIHLRVEPVRDDYLLDAPGPIGPRLATLKKALES